MSLKEYIEVLREAVRSENQQVSELAREALEKASDKRDTLDQILIHYTLD